MFLFRGSHQLYQHLDSFILKLYSSCAALEFQILSKSLPEEIHSTHFRTAFTLPPPRPHLLVYSSSSLLTYQDPSFLLHFSPWCSVQRQPVHASHLVCCSRLIWLTVRTAHPIVFAVPSVDRLGPCSEQTRKEADSDFSGVLGYFFLLITFGRNAILHLPIITSFVVLGQVFRLRLFFFRHGLPSLGPRFWGLGEVG